MRVAGGGKSALSVAVSAMRQQCMAFFWRDVSVCYARAFIVWLSAQMSHCGVAVSRVVTSLAAAFRSKRSGHGLRCIPRTTTCSAPPNRSRRDQLEPLPCAHKSASARRSAGRALTCRQQRRRARSWPRGKVDPFHRAEWDDGDAVRLRAESEVAIRAQTARYLSGE